ncbi:MAG: hypothetical protein AMXMBFR13_29780 [Phycisphaerae bacterium]
MTTMVRGRNGFSAAHPGWCPTRMIATNKQSVLLRRDMARLLFRVRGAPEALRSATAYGLADGSQDRSNNLLIE